MPIIRFRVQQLRILKKWAPSAAAVLPWPLTRWLLVNEQRSRRADKTLSAVLMNAEIPPASSGAFLMLLLLCCLPRCVHVLWVKILWWTFLCTSYFPRSAPESDPFSDPAECKLPSDATFLLSTFWSIKWFHFDVLASCNKRELRSNIT